MVESLLYRFAQTINYNALPKQNADTDLINTVLTIVFVILGAIAVMMVVIGGIQYASSQGDPQSTARAKNTIIYAIVGLVVVIFSRTIIMVVFQKVA